MALGLVVCSAVDACCQHGLHRGRHLNGRQRLRQPMTPGLTHRHPGLHQGAHALLQEERVALGALDEQGFERRPAGVIPQQGMQERIGASRWQRVQSQVRVGRLAGPSRADTPAGN